MNRLKVNRQQSIIGLYQQGWSKRRIARELQVDRETVRKYLAAEISKSPTPQIGSQPDGSSKPATPQTGSKATESSKSPTPQTGSASGGTPSSCEPWRAPIEKGLLAGLSVQRIYQDLVTEHQFTGSYFAVRRFVLRQQTVVELPYRRMECAPGQELQAATHHGAWRLRDLKRLLELPANVVQMDFLATHPLIRSLDAYRIEPTQTLPPSPDLL